MDYVTARLTGRITAIAAHVVHGAALRQPHARRDRVRRRARDSSRASTPTRLPPLVTGRQPPSARCFPTSRPQLGLPESVVVYAPHQRHRRGRDRDRRVHRRPRRARDRHHERARRRGRRLPHRPRAPDPLDAGPVRRPLRRVRGERPGRQGARARARATSSTPHDELADHRVADPFAPLDAVLDATDAGRGRRAVPALARRIARARPRAATMRGGFVNMSLETDRRRPRARGRRGRRAQPRVAAPARRGVHRRRDRRDRVRRRRGALARSGARCSPTCSTARRRRSPRPTVGDRPRDGAARAERHGVLTARRSRPAPRRRPAQRFEPDPARHERYAYRQVQFEAAYAALLPISEATCMSTLVSRTPQTHDVIRGMPSEGREPRRRSSPSSRDFATRRGQDVGDRQVLGHDVLRRPRALRLHERGVRAVRPRERAAARHVPERDQVRGRDHRHDARPAARRRGHRRRRRSGSSPSGGTGSILHAVLAYREHARADARHRRGPTSSSPRPRHPAFDKACHLLGVELRSAPVDPDDHAGRRRRDGRARSTRTRSRSSARPATTATAPIDPIEELVRPRARARRRPARRRLPRRVHPAVGPGARLRHPAVRLPRPRRHEHLGRHPQVRLRLQGHVGARCSATRRCATASTSS